MLEEMDTVLFAAGFLRQWMREVMLEHDWNAREWADKAGTSATNITRFLKGSDHIPSYSTLVKLATVAGTTIPTPGVAQRGVPQVTIPLLELLQLASDSRLSTEIKRARRSIVADYHGPRAFAVRLPNSDFAALGYVAGDILVIDPDLKPEPGKHVLATDGKGSGPCRYEPPHIYCVVGQKKIKIEKNTVIGTVVELIRKLV